MEDGEIEGTHPEEPTAPGHQTTEALPSSAALRDRPASQPDERAGPGVVNYIMSELHLHVNYACGRTLYTSSYCTKFNA